ncbi:MAG: glycosyltransferase family 4 protein [Nocardioidaceae bacterium]
MSRGRIVMLVDNSVHNDSRVQKQARSAAAHGWDVVLIGRSPTAKVQRFKLGDAKVRLVPVENALPVRRYQLRSGLLRGSLSYRSKRLASYRAREVEAKAYDARIRRMVHQQQVESGDRSPAAWFLDRARTKATLGLTAAEARWVRARAKATDQRTVLNSRLRSRPGHAWTEMVTRALGERAWRVLDPHLWDFEFAYAPVIDRLNPDIIHANDFAMVGVGARAAIRARARGRRVKLVYDAHEYVPGMNDSARHPWWLPAQVANEREHIRFADAVVTVSEPLADMLVEAHHLPERPTVVLNAPQVGESDTDSPPPDIRELCRIGRDVPLLVYSGSMTEARGVRIMVQALPVLEGVHVAFIVSSTEKPFVQELMDYADSLGVRDRVHLLPYVPPEQVVEYVAPADIGVHPTHHYLNHEISLATKFFEYAHARLPIVVSDVRTMSEMVRATGQGEVFRAEDLDDYVRAIRAVLAEPQRYRAAYDKPGQLEEWTWAKQAEILDGVYTRLLEG